MVNVVEEIGGWMFEERSRGKPWEQVIAEYLALNERGFVFPAACDCPHCQRPYTLTHDEFLRAVQHARELEGLKGAEA